MSDYQVEYEFDDDFDSDDNFTTRSEEKNNI